MIPLENIEPHLIKFIPDNGNVAIDVGANIGSWTHYLSNRFKTVYAIEPNPQALPILTSELPLNAKVIKMAAWDKKDYRDFLLYPPSELMVESTMDVSYILNDSIIGAIKLECCDIDSMDIDRPVDFIKMDIEGSELKAIIGARKLLEKDHPKIIIEVHHDFDVKSIIDILIEIGYSISGVDNSGIAVDQKWLVGSFENKYPVSLFIFNRPEITKKTFEVIRKSRPQKLLVIADGPRNSSDRCRECRDIATSVDWGCELITHFSDDNLGCAERMISGLNWVFDNVNESIILEDDIVPDLSFFRFCNEMLDRFRDDNRIGQISGYCPEYCLARMNAIPREKYSYWFSQLPRIWGWATWANRWSRYDRYITKWTEFKQFFPEIFLDPLMEREWAKNFDSVYKSTPEWQFTWDYQWAFANYFNNWLSVTPTVNLVDNIGFGADATHTTFSKNGWYPDVNKIEFPIKHPLGIFPTRSNELFGSDRWNQLFPDNYLP